MTAAVTQTWPDEFVERYRAAGYWRGETFGGWLRSRSESFPDRLAIVGGSVRWTYREFDALADRHARGFLDRGLSAGDRVLLQLPNVPLFFPVVFGLFRAGILPVFCLPAHRETELAHFARVNESLDLCLPHLVSARAEKFEPHTGA